MPTIITRGAGSAKGFGLFGKKKVLNTVTFSSGITTWTAPPGVNKLVIASGKGANGVSDYADPNPTILSGGAIVNPFGAAGTYGTLDWSQVYAMINQYAGSGGARGQTNRSVLWRIGTNDQLIDNGPYSDTGPYPNGDVYSTTSTVGYRQGGGTTPPTSGQVLYSFWSTPGAGDAGFKLQVYPYTFGSAGANTTGFGKTFPGGAYSGGTGYPATTTTYTNVAITAGTTYTIVNNGVLTIQYYA